jgi:hypothetical protein
MDFQFKGGISSGGEKLHVWLVINGYEQILYEALKTGFATMAGGVRYKTPHNLVKVFVSQVVSETVINHSFYFRLSDEDEAPEATITNVDGTAGYFFKARGRFLKKSEILPLLAPDNQSRFFLKSLSLALLRSMVSMKAYDEPAATGGRRVGKKKVRVG